MSTTKQLKRSAHTPIVPRFRFHQRLMYLPRYKLYQRSSKEHLMTQIMLPQLSVSTLPVILQRTISIEPTVSPPSTYVLTKMIYAG